MDCKCHPGQVLCFWRPCPRAVRIRAQQREMAIKAREALGDPRSDMHSTRCISIKRAQDWSQSVA